MNDDRPDDRPAILLPDIIQRYQRAHDDLDTSASLAAFAPTATVTDDGRTAHGHEQIRHWLETTASEFSYVRTLLGATSSEPDQWTVSNLVTGNFPGGTVHLSYRFALRDDLIQQLIIAPTTT